MDITYPVAADRAGHGIIQFGSYDDNHLWYALVNSSGSTITPPVVSNYSANGFSLSYTGGAITSHSMAPASANTDLYLDGPTAKAVVPLAPAFVTGQSGQPGRHHGLPGHCYAGKTSRGEPRVVQSGAPMRGRHLHLDVQQPGFPGFGHDLFPGRNPGFADRNRIPA